MKTLLASAALALLLTGSANAQTVVVGRDVGAIAVESLPAEPSIEYSGPLVVGDALPGAVIVYPVPQYDEYAYTVIGPRRVIVDRSTRRVLRVIEDHGK